MNFCSATRIHWLIVIPPLQAPIQPRTSLMLSFPVEAGCDGVKGLRTFKSDTEHLGILRNISQLLFRSMSFEDF